MNARRLLKHEFEPVSIEVKERQFPKTSERRFLIRMENRFDTVEVRKSHLLDARKKLIILESNRVFSVEFKDFD